MAVFFLLTILLSQSLQCIPDPTTLRKINYIHEASNIDIIKYFPEYADKENYRTAPHILKVEDLAIFNPYVDWNDPDSYSFKHPDNPYIARIKNAYIASDQLGTIFDDQQQLLFRLWQAEKKFRCDGAIFWQVPSYEKYYTVKYFQKIATVQGPTYYYHWLMDRMPSLYLLKKILDEDPEIKLLINTTNGQAPGYVQSYLDLLGIPKNQIIHSEPRTLYFGKEVYFATPFLVEPIPQKLLFDLRKALLNGANVTYENKAKKNILILQREERARHLLNLNEMVRTIQSIFPSEEFEIIIFSANKKSLPEQIKVFHQADLIIEAHGSGMANNLFARPGTPVIEINPDTSSYESYRALDVMWWLSSSIGLHHWLIKVVMKNFQDPIACPIDEFNKVLLLIKNIFNTKGAY